MTRLLIWLLLRRRIAFHKQQSDNCGVELVGGPFDGHCIREAVSWLYFPARPDCIERGRVLSVYAWDGRLMRFAGWILNSEEACRGK